MRLNQEDTSAFNTHLKSGKFSHSHKVLTTDLIITLKGSIVNAVDPNGADRIVYLPEREAGRFFVIGHIGTANVLSVQTAQGVELLQLQTGETALLFAGDPEWIGVSAQINLKVFGYTGPNHSEGLVPDPGVGPVDPNPENRRFLSELGWQVIGALTAGDDFYKYMKGGAVTLSPLGAETLEFTSANSILSILAVVGTTDAINFTINQSAIDHNVLTNYVADQHVAHSGVTLTAGIGLAGGGNIAASRTFDLDLNDITTDTPVLGDTFAFYDVSGSDTNKATLTVLNSILDHNALVNYVANQHIDHTTVSIVAGTGLTGGGNIAASRTLALDINGLTADTITTGDFFPFFDISGGDTNKITFGNLNLSLDHNALTNYVANQHIDHTTVSISTTEGIQGGGTIAATRTLKLDINTLTADASPDNAADYVATWDASASLHKKVLMNSFGFAPLASPSFTGTISLGGSSLVVKSGGYTQIYDGAGTNAALLLGNADPANYYRNTTHYFQSIGGGATWLTLNAAGGAVFGVNVTGLTASANDNSTKFATTAYADAADNLRMKLAGAQTVTGGFRMTPYSGGTVSSGTFTPDANNHNYQYYTNNGAHTLAAPANDCAIDILVTNGASAGAITFSGFTVGSSTGDALTTTNGNKFIISVRRINATATYVIKALQ